jgi:hypothetical protein
VLQLPAVAEQARAADGVRPAGTRGPTTRPVGGRRGRGEARAAALALRRAAGRASAGSEMT